jgi:RimJ/RimL family protein N-acetyltransferase
MTNQFEAYRQELLRSDRDPKTVAGIVQWAEHQPEVRQIEVETNIDNRASIRVLEKNSFVCVGVGLEPNTIRFLHWS